MENTQDTIIGTPGDIKDMPITNVAKGEDWGVTVEMRDYQGGVITGLDQYNVYIAWASTPGGEDAFEIFELADPEVYLIAPATAGYKFEFQRADMTKFQPRVPAYGDVWLEPIGSDEGQILQARIALTLKPSTRKQETAPVDETAVVFEAGVYEEGVFV